MSQLDRALWRATDWLVSLPIFPALVASFIAATILMVGVMEGYPA